MIILLLLLVLAGCASPPPQRVPIQVYDSQGHPIPEDGGMDCHEEMPKEGA